MKKPLIHFALTASAVAFLSSCDDNAATSAGNVAATDEASATTEATTLEEEAVKPDVTPEEVTAVFLPRIANRNYLAHVSTELQSTDKANGDRQIKAKITLSITEDLYNRSERPAEFHEAVKMITALHQDVERPDSSYLLDMGADTTQITDEERKVKQLPDNMRQMYAELVNLSESYCYKQDRSKDTQIVLDLTMDAAWVDNKWQISNIVETEDLLSPLAFLVPASSLEENAPVITPEFVTARLAEIATKADAFKTEAEAFHKSRQDALRVVLTERQAVQKEAEHKAQEAAAKEAAEAAARKELSDFCIRHFGTGCQFRGEWRRDTRFGELTIRIDNATLFENAIHFYGVMHDTKLPQAHVKISGRTALTRDEDGTCKVNVTLYEGAYDPDEPTAEVYDAADGRLLLTFDKNGNLKGIMTCASWLENPKRNFELNFSPVAPAEQQ